VLEVAKTVEARFRALAERLAPKVQPTKTVTPKPALSTLASLGSATPGATKDDDAASYAAALEMLNQLR
jgi:hypothetical protein